MNNKERFSRSINKHNLVKRITFPLCQPVFPSHQHLLRRFESEPKISILPNIVKKNEKTHTNKSKTAYITAISSVPYQDNKRITNTTETDENPSSSTTSVRPINFWLEKNKEEVFSSSWPLIVRPKDTTSECKNIKLPKLTQCHLPKVKISRNKKRNNTLHDDIECLKEMSKANHLIKNNFC